MLVKCGDWIAKHDETWVTCLEFRVVNRYFTSKVADLRQEITSQPWNHTWIAQHWPFSGPYTIHFCCLQSLDIKGDQNITPCDRCLMMWSCTWAPPGPSECNTSSGWTVVVSEWDPWISRDPWTKDKSLKRGILVLGILLLRLCFFPTGVSLLDTWELVEAVVSEVKDTSRCKVSGQHAVPLGVKPLLSLHMGHMGPTQARSGPTDFLRKTCARRVTWFRPGRTVLDYCRGTTCIVHHFRLENTKFELRRAQKVIEVPWIFAVFTALKWNL